MVIFDKKDKHIDSKDELKRDMKTVKYEYEDKKALKKVELVLGKKITSGYGLSKKEAIDAVKKLEKKGEIDHHNSYQLQKQFKKAA